MSPADIRTPLQAIDSCIEIVRGIENEVATDIKAPEAHLALWYVMEALDRLRDNVVLRAPLQPDTLAELNEMRAYAQALEDRILELEKDRE